MAMAGGTALYLLFAQVEMLQPVGRIMEPFFESIIPFLLFLILFVTFCKVDFHQMKLERWQLWILLCQLIATLGVVAVILWHTHQVNEKIFWESILTCIICPSASAAAVVTAKLGGHLGSMTTFTFLSSFATALLIPTVFPLVERGIHIAFISAFLLILQKVCIILILPLIAGWLVRKYIHPLYERLVKMKNLGFYLWGCLLSIVTGTTVKNLVHANASASLLTGIAVSSLLLCLLQFAVGKWIGHFSRNSINAGQALGQKNTAFAIWIAYTYLNPVATLGPGCYILWQNLVNSWELWEKRRETSPATPSRRA